jgi:hypothetical protein
MIKLRTLALFSALSLAAGCASTGGTTAPTDADKAAAAANCAGDWEIEFETPMGSQSVPMKLTQNGEQITGTSTDPAGSEVAVSGTCKGDAIFIAEKVQAPIGEIQLDWNGTITGNTMAGTVKFGDFAEGKFTGSKP